MISLETIEREIDELESRETTYHLCERLAWLYIVRDHLRPTKGDRRAQELEGSEFVEACNGKSYPAMMKVLDEHMEAIRAMYPKEYESVIDKIKAL